MARSLLHKLTVLYDPTGIVDQDDDTNTDTRQGSSTTSTKK